MWIPFPEFWIILLHLLFPRLWWGLHQTNKQTKLVNPPAIVGLINVKTNSRGQAAALLPLLSPSTPHPLNTTPSVIWKAPKRISLSGSRNSKLFELVPRMFTAVNFVYHKKATLGFQILPLSVGLLLDCSGRFKCSWNQSHFFLSISGFLKTRGHLYSCFWNCNQL